MNTVSPLSKDHRAKTSKESKPIIAKPKISLSTAKKVLKSSKREIGSAETFWLNTYIENRVRGECLPLNLYSNDIVAEIVRTFGDKAGTFTENINLDFNKQMPNPLSTS